MSSVALRLDRLDQCPKSGGVSIADVFVVVVIIRKSGQKGIRSRESAGL